MLSPQKPKTSVNKGDKFQRKLKHSFWRGANAWNVSFETFYDDQFTLSTQLITLIKITLEL